MMSWASREYEPRSSRVDLIGLRDRPRTRVPGFRVRGLIRDLGVPCTVGYCSGYYEARSASGRGSGKKYKAQIVIFCILLAVNRFLGKQKAVEENWKAVEENWKAVEENQKAVEDFETRFPCATGTGSMCAHGFGLVKSSTHNLK
jgi:hypothetical protein